MFISSKHLLVLGGIFYHGNANNTTELLTTSYLPDTTSPSQASSVLTSSTGVQVASVVSSSLGNASCTPYPSKLVGELFKQAELYREQLGHLLNGTNTTIQTNHQADFMQKSSYNSDLTSPSMLPTSVVTAIPNPPGYRRRKLMGRTLAVDQTMMAPYVTGLFTQRLTIPTSKPTALEMTPSIALPSSLTNSTPCAGNLSYECIEVAGSTVTIGLIADLWGHPTAPQTTILTPSMTSPLSFTNSTPCEGNISYECAPTAGTTVTLGLIASLMPFPPSGGSLAATQSTTPPSFKDSTPCAANTSYECIMTAGSTVTLGLIANLWGRQTTSTQASAAIPSITPLVILDPKPCVGNTSLECMTAAGSTVTLGPTGGLWRAPPSPQVQLATPTLCSWDPKGSYICPSISMSETMFPSSISTRAPNPTFGKPIILGSITASLPIFGSVRTITIRTNSTTTMEYTSSLLGTQQTISTQRSEVLIASTPQTTLKSTPTESLADTTDLTPTGPGFPTGPVSSSGLRKVKNPFWFLIVVCAGSALYASGIWKEEPRRKSLDVGKKDVVERGEVDGLLEEYRAKQDVESRTEKVVARNDV